MKIHFHHHRMNEGIIYADVQFKKGPPDDLLNIKFCNAYEQCDRQCTDKFTSYAVFLDCQINTSKDADFLCDKRIVVLALSTEDVSILFNGLYSDTLVYDFYYDGVSTEVNQYYRSRWARWRAILK
ncbi:unnamed protein product [Camellia sinensis]